MNAAGSSAVLIIHVSASKVSCEGVRCGAVNAAKVGADATSSGSRAPRRLVDIRNFDNVSPETITTSDSPAANVSGSASNQTPVIVSRFVGSGNRQPAVTP